MGYVIPDLGFGWEPHGGAWYGVISIGRNTPPAHTGFAFGPYNAPRAGAGATTMQALVASAADGVEAFADALGDLDTPTTGPWPDVSPAVWFAGLPSALQEALVDAGAAWADSGVLP